MDAPHGLQSTSTFYWCQLWLAVINRQRSRDPMETKTKSVPGAPRSTSAPRPEKPPERTRKKQAAPPSKANPAPAPAPAKAPAPAPATQLPAAVITEKPFDNVVKQDKAAGDEAAMQNESANHGLPAGGAEAEDPKTDCMDSLRPLLIGGAVIAGAAILVGLFLLARRN
ncbi:hypothetical protein AGOR_G00108430 [Albula goreensis]|uniref:Cell cycle exit and neuronal differentiation protein 1 n=1 Tax=Albula goreensis TaxID=1534307 RepID=A0A8T3DGY5_9TELE|nr:hypothetical protein AGOR_G00108430 [Albula goreensis]